MADYEISTKEEKFNIYDTFLKESYVEAFNKWIYKNSQESFSNYSHFFTLTFRDKRVTNGNYTKHSFTSVGGDDGRQWLLARDWDKAPYKVGLQRLTKNLDWLYSEMKKFTDNFVIVTEEGSKKGRLHLHGLFHLDPDNEWAIEKYISTFSKWQSKVGFVKCEEIKDHGAVSAYVTKYMTKDIWSNPNGFRMYNKTIKNKENL